MPWRKLSPAPNKLDMEVNFTQFPFSFFPRLHQKESVRPAPIGATNHGPSVLIMATAFNSIATNSIVRLWTDVLLVPPREGALLISQVKGRTGKLLNNPMCGSAAKLIDSSDNRFLIRGSDPVRSGVLGQNSWRAVVAPSDTWRCETKGFKNSHFYRSDFVLLIDYRAASMRVRFQDSKGIQRTPARISLWK